MLTWAGSSPYNRRWQTHCLLLQSEEKAQKNVKYDVTMSQKTVFKFRRSLRAATHSTCIPTKWILNFSKKKQKDLSPSQTFFFSFAVYLHKHLELRQQFISRVIKSENWLNMIHISFLKLGTMTSYQPIYGYNRETFDWELSERVFH